LGLILNLSKGRQLALKLGVELRRQV